MSEYILRVKDIVKSFVGVKALQGVSLDIKKGEVHCLAGENGSGKSTLIKIVSGVYEKDSGTIEIDGEIQSNLTPIKAIRSGVQVIYQDFSVFPNLTVYENIAFNSELMDNRILANKNRFRQIAQEAVEKINFNVDLDAIVGDLSVADKQLVAISRALINNAKLIIMDEPTTALTQNEVKALFKRINDLKDQGISILFVSHKLDEVFEISDRFTIFRNGQNVFTGPTSELDNESFSYFMTNRKFQETPYEGKPQDEEMLRVENLTSEGEFYNINFSLNKGEILGIAGLLGSGRTELALSLFGMNEPDKGKIYIKNNEVEFKDVADSIEHGLGYVPEDRLTEGLFLEQSIGLNIVAANLPNLSGTMDTIDGEATENEITTWIDNLSIKVADPKLPVQTLSGGNQQRVVLGKWLATKPDVLILNGPTVGVDIGSKHDIHTILKELAEEGLAIIIISDDIPELITLSSRILLMRDGQINEEINSAETSVAELTEKISLDIDQVV
ncbi:MAG: sugar ABC transporter ATP-binding protein [Clostridiaceae bacterium]|nr:sugar ABC transporter ATP-binding protein [Clostridiaceae bacterium]